jgi:heme oxygenase
MGIAQPCDNLRASLRGATASAHDLLDHAMRAASGWTSRADYIQFLKLQHSARRPVEAWLEANADAATRPPPQCPLIARDLAQMDCDAPEEIASFALDGDGDDSRTLGVAWVLAGSSLGNRAILKEVTRVSQTGAGEPWPHSFLADEAMLTFWKGLRNRIERPARIDEVEAASGAAAAVFDHFLAATANREQGE